MPQLLPPDALAQANSLDQLIRPLALRLAGPAARRSAGWRGRRRLGVRPGRRVVRDLGRRAAGDVAVTGLGRVRVLAGDSIRGPRDQAGLRYVRQQPWLWATLVSAAVAYLLFMGPTEVLLPFVVKHRFADGATDLGLIFAAGGLGSLACALAIGQLGLPRRSLTFMYGVWTLGTLAVAGYGLSNRLWGLMLASVIFNTLETAGTIAWATAKQHHVPSHLLGRVSSLDWLISIGLLPLSYALTGPISAGLGVRTTLMGAGVLGAIVTFVPVLSRRVRRLDVAGSGGPLPETVTHRRPSSPGRPSTAPAARA